MNKTCTNHKQTAYIPRLSNRDDTVKPYQKSVKLDLSEGKHFRKWKNPIPKTKKAMKEIADKRRFCLIHRQYSAF
jgi:hypothetical protein